MTYKIEITADSISELAGRILAMAAQYQVTPVQPTIIVTHSTKSEVIDPVMPEVKQAAAGEQAPSESVADAVSAVSPSPVSKIEPVTTNVESAPSPSDAAPAVDYTSDIVPRVLNLVQVKGRDVVAEVLTQFGVAKASEVSVELLPELLAALDEALNG